MTNGRPYKSDRNMPKCRDAHCASAGFFSNSIKIAGSTYILPVFLIGTHTVTPPRVLTLNGCKQAKIKFGDIQETALIPLAIKASETARPDARIKDYKAKEIIDTLGVDLSALDGEWTKQIPKSKMYIIVTEGVLEYFSKEQVKTCLNMLCDSFEHGYLLAELHSPFREKHGSRHDSVKHTNAKFGW